ncbi:ABC transporter ATP-binding protein [uncultured Jannaschia sp.]|uniref:ABC transporter ATP-binding protein n=1 Tax=uncultured Jannaschia sp. TaxID=293347 RepID=UPI0026032FD9|nr:ABC transporter ATP-binding protein [uncultured Jannaschia sp.]
MKTTPTLEVRNLCKTFAGKAGLLRSGRRARVVTDVSFRIGQGEIFGLVGESGSGKSTIGRTILRLLEPDSGEILFGGRDITGLSAADLRKLRRHMQIIFQDPFSSLDPRVRVGEVLAEPIRLHRLREGHAVEARVDELLRIVGLAPHHKGRYPHEFSGGQRQRIAIARALAVEPALIVCDEAVSALDVSIQAQVLNLLARLRAELGVSYLFISHDMSVVRHISDRVGVLYAGRLVETGSVEAVFERPSHPYTRMLLAATPSLGGRRGSGSGPDIEGSPPGPFEPIPGCAFASRCPHATETCLAASPPLDTFREGDHMAACWHAETLPPFQAEGEAVMSDAFERRMALLRRARAGAET